MAKFDKQSVCQKYFSGMTLLHAHTHYTGDSHYVDFADLTSIQATTVMSTSRISRDSPYVDFAYLTGLPLCRLRVAHTITYVEVIFHSQHFFSIYLAFQLRLCRKRLTWSNTYLEVIFHALDVFSITFATAYVEVKNRLSQGRCIVCLGYVYAFITWGAKIFQTVVKTIKVI